MEETSFYYFTAGDGYQNAILIIMIKRVSGLLWVMTAIICLIGNVISYAVFC